MIIMPKRREASLNNSVAQYAFVFVVVCFCGGVLLGFWFLVFRFHCYYSVLFAFENKLQFQWNCTTFHLSNTVGSN